MIVCLVLPGNVYPVTESPTDDTVALTGAPCKIGYQSHYVLVNKVGTPDQEEQRTECDELVVFQESQVLPRYVLFLKKKDKKEAQAGKSVLDEAKSLGNVEAEEKAKRRKMWGRDE